MDEHRERVGRSMAAIRRSILKLAIRLVQEIKELKAACKGSSAVRQFVDDVCDSVYYENEQRLNEQIEEYRGKNNE